MPWYTDRHDDVYADPYEIVAEHAKDLAVQHRYGVKYVTGWFDKDLARYFCLVEAPSKQAASAVHQEAHDAVANEIIEVGLPNVEEFMGSVADTPMARDHRATEQVPALRLIMFTDMESSTAITHQLGDAKAMDLVRAHNALVRAALDVQGGREVKHTGDGIMASFLSASAAVRCALDISQSLAIHNEESAEQPIRVRIGLSAGEPVLEHEDLFGAAVQLAKRICDCAAPGEILVANVVRDLCVGKAVSFEDRGERELKGVGEPVRLWAVVAGR